MPGLKLKQFLPHFTIALMAIGLVCMPHNTKASEISVETVEGAETIGVKKAKVLFDAGSIFIDSRSVAAFDTGRISGAESVPLSKKATAEDFEVVKASLAKLTTKDEPLVLYCNGIKCPLSAAMAVKAIKWGYSKVYYFRDGYPAWKKAGYAVE